MQLPVLHNSAVADLVAKFDQVPALTKEEEFELAARLREDGDIDAAHRLITANLRNVVRIAMDYAGYDTIIVFANHPEDGEKSDSETLLTVLGLKQILAERNLSIPIIIEIEKNRNEEILQYASVDDFIISNVLSTKMLCQVAENRGLNAVFADLLDVQGSEIYLKRAEDYVPLGEPADFHLVTAAASRKNEIAIGYRTARTGADGGVVLDPDKSVPLVFSPGDRIIVMAED